MERCYLNPAGTVKAMSVSRRRLNTLAQDLQHGYTDWFNLAIGNSRETMLLRPPMQVRLQVRLSVPDLPRTLQQQDMVTAQDHTAAVQLC